MLFNSIEFFVFFVIVFGLYWVSNHRWQNRILLVASYFFYSCWDWRFLSLILLTTVVDYWCGLAIESAASARGKKKYILISVISNLLGLGVFKYYDFFVSSLIDLFSFWGIPVNIRLIHVILPVGISFYTFQSLSYTVDVYRGTLKAARRFSDFALFVAFFPQLVAGPIERASHLLPQVINTRKFSSSQFYAGCYLMFWGLFEKIFIAGNMARMVDPVFAKTSFDSGGEVLVAVYAFAFQIFCDFDAYSNIARGAAKCLGFDLMINFRLPYFSTNPQEFWSRWHISLSTWLRDYLYIPLGGNKKWKWLTYRNLFLTMALGGLWHGAAYTFVLWGIYHGTLLVLHRMLVSRKKINSQNRPAFTWGTPFKMLFVFHLVCFGWLLFRAESLQQVGQMLCALGRNFVFDTHTGGLFLKFILFLLPLWVVQIGQYKTNDLDVLYRQHWVLKTFIYALMTHLMLGWGIMTADEFIYFQF